MEIIFYIVAWQLVILGELTGLTYNEMNIVAYYIIIPYSYLVLIDKIFEFHYLKILFVVFLAITIPFLGNLHLFCDKLFEKSVEFLESFEKINLDYTTASVFICVFGVLIIYWALLWLNTYADTKRKLKLK